MTDQDTKRERKFELGERVATASIGKAMSDDEAFMAFVVKCGVRYEDADWGEIEDDEDVDQNNEALEHGGRLMGVYDVPEALRRHVHPLSFKDCLWIITDADRSATTVLWPGEY